MPQSEATKVLTRLGEYLMERVSPPPAERRSENQAV